MDFRLGSEFDFDDGRRFIARVVEELDDVPLPEGTLLNVNVPAGEPEGVEVTRLGKRIYRDELKLDAEDEDGRRRYWIYGAEPGFHDERGHRPRRGRRGAHRRDAAALRPHRRRRHGRARALDLARLLAPAAREVE